MILPNIFGGSNVIVIRSFMQRILAWTVIIPYQGLLPCNLSLMLMLNQLCDSSAFSPHTTRRMYTSLMVASTSDREQGEVVSYRVA